jgi:predicted nucleotidyltransferase
MSRVSASELLRAAREDVQMTQAELAAAAGIHQPTLAAYESGRRSPSAKTMQKILRAARIRPSIPLKLYADDIVAAAAAHGIESVRVFGSTLTGDDTETSDIDLLIATRSGVSIFDVGAFALEVEELTGFDVDIITERQAEKPRFAHVLAQAVPV